MRILIDARMYGLKHAGIGRYVMNLVHELMVIDHDNKYTILLGNEDQHKFLISNFKFSLKTSHSKSLPHFKFQIANIPHYSVREQINLPKIISDIKPDLVHFPHFNVPIFWRGKYVLTIHDLTKHSSRGMGTTTRNPLLYWAKYVGYKTVFNSAVRHAEKIFVPSSVVGEDLVRSYDIQPQKIKVTYEGVDETYFERSAESVVRRVLRKYKLEQPYVIYTGNAYPHKNLDKLVEAIKYFNDIYQYSEKMQLVVVSSRSVFLDRLQKVVEKHQMQKHVKFLGYIPDNDLVALYKNAKAFVFPSIAEGFGLPGIEAMASGCPVICSDIPVFREVYGNAAVYFDSTNVGDIADKIKMVITDGDLCHDMIDKGKKRAAQFSWRKMAEETLRVYNAI